MISQEIRTMEEDNAAGLVLNGNNGEGNRRKSLF
jgi:hypothetical protein